jgi:putative sigma-54 modulation protein
MIFNIHGNKVKITQPIEDYIEEKIGRLGRYFGMPDDLQVNVQIRVKGIEQKIEVTIPTKHVILRAEEAHKDLYAAIDLVSEKLESQLRKNKTRMSKRKVKDHFEDFKTDYKIEKEEDVINQKIVKRKSLDIKPMCEEEAILQMDLLGHEFFVFKHATTLEMCVLYRRKDGHYGLISTNRD